MLGNIEIKPIGWNIILNPYNKAKAEEREFNNVIVKQNISNEIGYVSTVTYD